MQSPVDFGFPETPADSNGGVCVKKFTIRGDAQESAEKYALAHSSRRRAMAALGGMEFDAQVAFIGAGDSWMDSPLKAIRNFGKIEAEDTQNLTLLFFPKQDATNAVQAIREWMEDWAAGEAKKSSAFGYPGEGWVGVGLNIVPDGLFVAIAEDIGGALNLCGNPPLGGGMARRVPWARQSSIEKRL